MILVGFFVFQMKYHHLQLKCHLEESSIQRGLVCMYVKRISEQYSIMNQLPCCDVLCNARTLGYTTINRDLDTRKGVTYKFLEYQLWIEGKWKSKSVSEINWVILIDEVNILSILEFEQGIMVP